MGARQAGVLLATGIVLVSQDARAYVTWSGYGTILSSAEAACGYDRTGSEYYVRYQPRALSGNGPHSSMGWFEGGRSAISFRLSNAAFDPTFRAVESGQVYSHFYTFGTVARIVFDTQSPATVTTSTQTIQITGRMQNFTDQPGCTIRFKLLLHGPSFF